MSKLLSTLGLTCGGEAINGECRAGRTRENLQVHRLSAVASNDIGILGLLELGAAAACSTT